MGVLWQAVHQGSPTGSCILAQGKTASAVAALGKGRSLNGRLKVCFIRSGKIVLMMQTFSLRILLFTPPRALPWASMREPVGLDETAASRRKPPSLLDCLRKRSPACLLPSAGVPKTQKRELWRGDGNRFR